MKIIKAAFGRFNNFHSLFSAICCLAIPTEKLYNRNEIAATPFLSGTDIFLLRLHSIDGGIFLDVQSMTKEELTDLIQTNAAGPSPILLAQAQAVRDKIYGRRVFARGLIEFTNYCKNNCYYCGIRAANKHVRRYRLTGSDISACCAQGAALGFHTFVLQGGEDPFFTDTKIAEIVYSIKTAHPDCAVTLSIGERPRASYRMFRTAGADRYLLRHETATNSHYRHLHPQSMSLACRKQCLYDLKDLGFQVGAGFMVGSPGQTAENLAEDLLFLKELHPHMVGIGPFLPHKDTPFRDMPAGSVPLTLTMLALTRILLPAVLLPSTTALATADGNGHALGLSAGANVVMPNLSPTDVRADYSLYNNKASFGNEAAESVSRLRKDIEAAGYILDMARGDCIEITG